MNPIFDQNDLYEHIKRYGWNHDESQWILIILANPNSHGPALREVYSNFIYLDDRTEEVSFFLPGYANMIHQVVTWYYGEMPWIPGQNGEKLIFDQGAFVRTVRWLESEGYRYSESAELLFLEYKKDLFSPKFDLSHIVSFNLDNLVRNGVNLTAFFKSCNQVVRGEMSLRDLEGQFYMEDGRHYGLTEPAYAHRSVNVFIAGSKEIRSLRNAARAALVGITNRSRKGYVIKAFSFEDFATSLTPEGRQEDYMRFIEEKADYVIILLDSGVVGNITYREFVHAMQCYVRNGRPRLYVYNRKGRAVLSDHPVDDHYATIVRDLNSYHQYYTDFTTETELELMVKDAFLEYI